jgi:isopentenyl diphosphate isomerase/L-lactate dehydrogenase-like FMN-dependent dehydrogenase
MARPFLLAAHAGEESLHQFVESVLEELRICMFATGSQTVAALRGKLQPVTTPNQARGSGGGR